LRTKLEITRKRGTSNIVGGFFEELGCKLFAGEDCHASWCDFANWKHGIGFEVKSSDNQHPFRIPVLQLEDHDGNVEVGLLKENVYLLCKYNNKQKGTRKERRRSILHRLRSKDEIWDFLARNKIEMHVLDIAVIKAFRKKFYAQRELSLGLDGGEAIEMYHKTLRRLKDREYLRELELAPHSFEIKMFELYTPIKIGLLKCIVHTSVTSILSRSLAKKIDKVLFPLAQSELGLNGKTAAA
jgi:hypothetical protein